MRLFNYPAPSDNARSKAFAGHAGDVTNVRFAPNDSHVLTTGGGDHAVFQWALEADEAADSGEEVRGVGMTTDWLGWWLVVGVFRGKMWLAEVRGRL